MTVVLVLISFSVVVLLTWGITLFRNSASEKNQKIARIKLALATMFVLVVPISFVVSFLTDLPAIITDIEFLIVAGLLGYWAYSYYQITAEKTTVPEKTVAGVNPKDTKESVAEAVSETKDIPEQWRHILANTVSEHGFYTNEVTTVSYLKDIARYLNLARYQPGGPTRIWDLAVALPDDDGTGMKRALFLKLDKFGQDFRDTLLSLGSHYNLPEAIRTQHHHIVAGTGAGKSQCIQQLVAHDLTSTAAIVVIDSQGDLINTIATRVPEDRLILVDPEHCPPALNIFSTDTDVATATELFEYIFAALDTKMTTKQATAYRFVSRLLLAIPEANIHTMREILEPGTKHQEHVAKLGETAQSFFENEYNGRQFAETRSQILGRLYTVLENETFERMLSATSSNLDVKSAIASGKVILINTAKAHLKQTAASLLGRIFIAQVMQAVMGRENRRRTYLYLDEFQDYAEDSHVLFNLFEQARKYELGLIVAHQYLGQLPPQLMQSVAANTAIKFASKVSAQDARALASQMQTQPEFIQNREPGSFAAYVRGEGILTYGVEFGKLERTPEISSLSSIRENMRKKYGLPSPTEKSPKTLNLQYKPRRGRRED